MDKSKLSPDKVILHSALRYVPAGGKLAPNTCTQTSPGVLLLLAQNHLGQLTQVMLKFNLDGDPEDGPPARFVLSKLGPTVWSLSPSVTAPGMLHAFATLVGVPEPAPWEVAAPVAIKVRCEKCDRVFETTTARHLVDAWRTTDSEPFKVPSSWCCTENGRFAEKSCDASEVERVKALCTHLFDNGQSAVCVELAPATSHCSACGKHGTVDEIFAATRS